MSKIKTLFETQKSFSTEVKLMGSDVWLTLNAGFMNENMATVIATGISNKKLNQLKINHIKQKTKKLTN